MGQSFAKDLSTHFDNFKHDVFKGTLVMQKEALVIKEVMGLTYSEFLNKVKELNQICCRTVDCNGRTLLFVIKGGSDSTVLWRQTVEIACVRVIKETKKVEDYKLLSLKQFLQAHKTVLFHTSCISGIEATTNQEFECNQDGDETKECSLRRNPISTSMILNQIGSADAATDLDECIICMERKSEVTLPCAHSYCLFCIEQWNVSNKTCPICRETLENTDDSWVIPEIPETSEVNAELHKALQVLSSKELQN